jgi:selenium metabolism protein YedF
MKTLDCRGLACPAPVLTTKQTIEKENLSRLTVVVDNEAARQNVTRFLESQQFQVSTESNEQDFLVTGQKESAAAETVEEKVEESKTHRKRIMVVVATDRMGHGDDTLGQKLMINFLKTLREMGDELWRLVFINNGVKLTTDDAETIDELKVLEKRGVSILVCGTCLTHFNLMDKKKVGETTNMLDIVTAMQIADTLINI